MLQYINVNRIDAHPDNPRKDLGDLTELAESIKANGILQNLTVVPWFSSITRAPADNGQMDGHYRAVIGHRRLAAAKLAGLTEVPCMVADMGPREQIATMLLENMQRNDLTVYEQAQGFQLMLDFGETVNEIAERTGFSESTVRRRVKLLELDGDKFKESEARGATLQDYAELEKIEDIELRNKVLDKIGTANFRWELDHVIAREKAEKNMPLLIADLERFAMRTDNNSGMNSGMMWAGCYYGNRNASVAIPEDAGEKEYYYVVNESCQYITVYKSAGKASGGSVDQSAEAERLEKHRQRRAGLEEATDRAFQLRRAFVKHYAGAKKHAHDIMVFAALVLVNDSYYSLDDETLDMLGIAYDEEDEEKNTAQIKAAAIQSPERGLLVAAYCNGADSPNAKYYSYLDYSHCKCPELDFLYEFLEKIGYEISDEERALRDGSHERFAKSMEETP